MKDENKKRFDWEKYMHLSLDGDMEAYRILLEQLSEKVDDHLQYKIHDQNDIPDLCQDIILTMHKARYTYDKKRAFLPWAMAITKYKIVDYINKKTRENRTFSSMESIDQVPLDINSIRKVEHNMELEALMTTLNTREQDLLAYVKLNGYSVKEAANEFNISESNVKTSIHRILKKLKQISA